MTMMNTETCVSRLRCKLISISSDIKYSVQNIISRKMLKSFIFTARGSYDSVVLGIVILFVCLSVTRVLCDKMKEHTADILIPYKRAITLVF